MVTVSVPHPAWCDRDRCNATESGTGTHLSARVTIEGSPVAAWMQAPASQPDMVSVRVACAERLMSPQEAYRLGRVLTSLGKAARRTSASAGGVVVTCPRGADISGLPVLCEVCGHSGLDHGRAEPGAPHTCLACPMLMCQPPAPPSVASVARRGETALAVAERPGTGL